MDLEDRERTVSPPLGGNHSPAEQTCCLSQLRPLRKCPERTWARPVSFAPTLLSAGSPVPALQAVTSYVTVVFFTGQSRWKEYWWVPSQPSKTWRGRTRPERALEGCQPNQARARRWKRCLISSAWQLLSQIRTLDFQVKITLSFLHCSEWFAWKTSSIKLICVIRMGRFHPQEKWMAFWSLKTVVLLPHGRVFIRDTVGLVPKERFDFFLQLRLSTSNLTHFPLWQVVMGEKI